ncbi:MAG: DUF4923 family protein [Alistipes sp.]|nr:DUF4923 family protein [Alistipes sp.]
MKRILLIITFLLFGFSSVQAQSLDALLKGLFGSSSEQTAPSKANKPTYPTEDELIGKWVFQQLEMEYSGGDPLATVAIASAKQQLSTLATKAELTPGKDFIKFKGDGTLTFVSGDRKASATYTYIPPTGMLVITLSNESETIRVSATASVKDGKRYLMFSADELITLAGQSVPALREDSMFAVAQALSQTYPGITVGASFE